MKKIIAVFLSFCLVLFAFTACTDKPLPYNNSTSSEITEPNTPDNSKEDSRPMSPEITEPNIPQKPTIDTTSSQEVIKKMYISINGNKLEVTLIENSSVNALVEILKSGDITYTANDYGGFEKVGSLGYTLPKNNLQITAQAGDVILYSSNQIVLFYGSNSWSYTRLGKINGYSVLELCSLLGAGEGSVQITISLN